MNTTASYSSEHSWSRRCSTETVFSIQGQETDFVRDTSDTEFDDDGDAERGGARAARGLEYEPATDSDSDEPPVDCGDSSGETDDEIIATKVVAVSVGDDGDVQFADAEQTESGGADSELELPDYWRCAQCRARNNNPLYRYCEKCYKVRKDFFPPRPKRKRKRNANCESIPRTLSQDSGVGSQELSQYARAGSSTLDDRLSSDLTDKPVRKRRSNSADRSSKRLKIDYRSDSDSDSSIDVKPLVKTISDPSITIDEPIKLTKKFISNTLKQKMDNDNLCIVCFSEPKSGVFVHGRVAHICCCYKCAMKVWAKAKRCPVCNCKVSNVLKAVVM